MSANFSTPWRSRKCKIFAIFFRVCWFVVVLLLINIASYRGRLPNAEWSCERWSVELKSSYHQYRRKNWLNKKSKNLRFMSSIWVFLFPLISDKNCCSASGRHFLAHWNFSSSDQTIFHPCFLQNFMLRQDRSATVLGRVVSPSFSFSATNTRVVVMSVDFLACTARSCRWLFSHNIWLCIFGKVLIWSEGKNNYAKSSGLLRETF